MNCDDGSVSQGTPAPATAVSHQLRWCGQIHRHETPRSSIIRSRPREIYSGNREKMEEITVYPFDEQVLYRLRQKAYVILESMA
jgi:hypothetical protein